jgi:glycine cleavage system aminomethyltransferase T
MVPDAPALKATLLDRGAPFDVVEADLDVLDQAALENWYFNIRREGSGELSPVELQLQWRVSARKQFAGSAALAERRARATHRIVQCASASPLAVGDRVTHGDREIGSLINAGFSASRNDWVAIALVERAYSHANITAYAANGHPIRTLAAPAINNRSLYVNPQLHSYQTRDEVQFPSLVLPEQQCASPTAP